MKSQDDLAVVAKTYDFCLWLLPLVAKFPRSHRFTLGDRMEEEGLSLLLGLVEAKYCCEKRELHRVASVVEEYLDRHLRLTLHKDKALLQPTSEGLPFLGFLVFPDHRRLLNASSHRYRRKLRRMSRAYGKGLLDLGEVTLSVQVWVAHASFGNTRRLRHDLLGRVMFPTVQRSRG